MSDLCLLDSARMSLVPGVVLEGAQLKDSCSGDGYTLNGLGQYLASQLEAGARFKDLIASIRRTYDVGEDEVRRDLQRFISALDALRLLSIKQSLIAEVALRFRGRRSPNRHYPATPLGILAGSLKAHQPTAVVGLILTVAIQPVVFLPLIRHGRLPSIGMAVIAAQPLLAYTALLVASIILHELIHYWTAVRLGVRLRSVYVRPGVVGISQLDVGSKRNLVVSAAGPAGTVLVLLLLAVVTPALPLGYPFAGLGGPILCVAVAIVHMLGLTPLTNDGRQAWRLIRIA